MNIIRPRRNDPMDAPKEMALLLLCSRTRIDFKTAERIRILASGELNWVRLYELAHRHRVAPLLYKSLHANCPGMVPKELMGRLRRDYHANSARTFVLANELLRLLRLLREHGIPTLPFKGPVLSEQAYGDLALRQFEDLDILVRLNDAPAASGILRKDGFRLFYWGPRSFDEALLLRYGELGFVRPDGRFQVDLHWRVVPRDFDGLLGQEGIWLRRCPTDLMKVPVWGLSPEDTLLVLTMHGMRHAWPRLGWICDLAETIRTWENMDWRWLISRVESFGAGKVLAVGLTLVESLLEVTLAEAPRRFLTRHASAEPIAMALDGDIRQGSQEYSVIRTDLFNLRAREGLRAKIRYAKYRAMQWNLTDLAWIPLPRNSRFLYAFLRPLRLLIKYILPAIGQAIGEPQSNAWEIDDHSRERRVTWSASERDQRSVDFMEAFDPPWLAPLCDWRK